MPKLEDLHINCTNFSPNVQPIVFVPFALKKYAFHYRGWVNGRQSSISSGWSLPLVSSRISICELELTITVAEDLVELLSSQQLCSVNKTGALFFPQLRTVKLSILQDFSIFAPLLAQCPRVQTLHLISDIAQMPQLPQFIAIVDALPTADCLRHLAFGLSTREEYYTFVEVTPNQSLRIDKELQLQLRRLSGIQRLKSFTVLADPENSHAIRLPQVRDECRERRIAFRISPTL